MATFNERCAYAFARDLPADRPIQSAALRALVERLAARDSDDSAETERELMEAPRDKLQAAEDYFRANFLEDMHRCATETDRIGQLDHFLFEDWLRRDELRLALEEGNDERVARLWTAGSGTHSPFARREVSEASHHQWPVLEALAEAVIGRDGAKALEARSIRRSINSRLREHVADLALAVATVVKRFVPRTRTTPAPAPPPPPAPALTVEMLGRLGSVAVARATLPPNVYGDHFIVRPARIADGLVAFLEQVSTALTTAVAANAGDTLLLIQAFSAHDTVEVVVTLCNGSTEVASQTLFVPGAPLSAIGAPDAPFAAPTAPTAAAPLPPPTAALFGAEPPSHPSPASLTADPNLQRALSRFFAQDAVSDTDLFTIGGAMLIARWAAEFPGIARRAGLQYVMEVGPGGKVYRVG